MKSIFASPIFWIIFFLISALCFYVFFALSPIAFPITHLNITMDKDEALKKAQALSARLSLGPKNFRQATTFDTDVYVTTFVELEGGGKEALVRMMSQDLYQPYFWKVRHFNPGSVDELYLRFTPDGRAYGFSEIISENTPGAKLSAKEAKDIAQKSAVQDWGINFDVYDLKESSEFVSPSMRLDHVFVYERKDENLIKGRYELRLRVSGDRLSELLHFVDVPEDFALRYQEMRSVNERITWIATISAFVLYILGCLVIGLFYLLNKRLILWQWPMLCALIIAFLNLLSMLNHYPTWWMEYNTAINPKTFILDTIINILFKFAFLWAAFSIVFSVAEGLTRRAFPNHLQLFKIWHFKTASSPQVLGQSLAGYLLVSFFLAFQAAFYIITAHYFNWWIPSETVINPNILGMLAPWLTPVASALTAGSLEECIFRALPLASAALLGNRFGHRKSLIALAFILQAIIFAAAHANYPMQPAYARLIELIIPAMIFGGLYLAFGLLPAIINHFIFDLFWMSMPIFLSSGTWIIVSEILVIVIGLIPLLIVLFAIIKERSFKPASLLAYNSSYVQPAKMPFQAEETLLITRPLPRLSLVISFILGFLGFILWFVFAQFQADTPPMLLDRQEAVKEARNYLLEHNIQLDESFKALAQAVGPDQDSGPHDFIWQEGGKDLYQRLLGRFLKPPHWHVRFARFSGPIEERAEEYQLDLDGSGRVISFNHILPEGVAAPSLSIEEAKKVALAFITKELNINTSDLLLKSAEASQFPGRTDWAFAWSDPKVYTLGEGGAQLYLGISGTEISSWSLGIRLPEEWLRKEDDRQQRTYMLLEIIMLPFFAVLFIGVAFGFRLIIKNPSKRKLFLISTLFFAVPLVFNTWNKIPNFAANFKTIRSFEEQIIISLITQLVLSIIISVVLAFLFTYIFSFRSTGQRTNSVMAMIVALFLGIFLAGIESLAAFLAPANSPTFSNILSLNYYMPALNNLILSAGQYLGYFAFLFLIVIFIKLKLDTKKKGILLAVLILVLSGFVLNYLSTNLWLFVAMGFGQAIVFVILWFTLSRFDYTTLPLFAASYFVMGIIKKGLIDAYPFSILNAVFVSIVILAIAVFIHFALKTPARQA